MSKVTGIRIDPFDRTLAMVEFNPRNSPEICGLLNAESFDMAYTIDGHVIFVDDEGPLKHGNKFFAFNGYHRPLANVGLMAFADGEDIYNVRCSIMDLLMNLRWLR